MAAHTTPTDRRLARHPDSEWLAPAREEEDTLVAEFGPAAVIAALAAVVEPRRVARLRQVVEARLAGLILVLENLHDPHNGGAALRSCESVGVLEVQVIAGIDERRPAPHGAIEPFRVARKVTQGCDKWLDVRVSTSAEAALGALRARGVRLLAAVPGAALRLEDIDPLQPTAMLIGNEHAGLTPAARAACDAEFTIPLHGFSQSVNLSVATALSLYTHATRRRAALGRPGDLDPAAAELLLARYLLREQRGARAILEHARRAS